ncbi:MAG: potassium-transporting ATPase subunit KdpA, partial [Solirubrobacteraceae bacterium]
MNVEGWIEILLFIVLLTALTPVIGGYMARVFRGEVTTLGFVERPLYRLLGVDAARGQDWKAYARSVLIVSVGFGVLLYAIVRAQGLLPLNPQGLGAPPWDLSFNTAASFLTNTNWQYYAGETTVSYFTQM